MQGIIVKGIAGFYYVRCTDGIVYECKAKGVFRKDHKKPLVGDRVSMDILDQDKALGHILEIMDRKNELIRPAVANIDQAMVVFAIREPDINLNLLDRFLVYMGMQDIPVIIYFNKADLNRDGLMERLTCIYENTGCRVICGSTSSDETVSEIREAMRGKTTVLAGPSGAGKSSLTNRLNDGVCMEVGELSARIKRGRQTTRHTELFTIDPDSYVLDTPGFTSLFVTGVEAGELGYYYPEFGRYTDSCRYTGCSHIYEAEGICAVRRAVASGDIPAERYESYRQIYEELKDKEYR